MKKIIGGGIFLARRIEDHLLWQRKPPAWRLVWIHLLLRVSFSSTKNTHRGTGWFTWSSSQAFLHGIGRYEFYRALRWLEKQEMITTKRTTRGILITIKNYERFQYRITSSQKSRTLNEVDPLTGE